MLALAVDEYFLVKNILVIIENLLSVAVSVWEQSLHLKKEALEFISFIFDY